MSIDIFWYINHGTKTLFLSAAQYWQIILIFDMFAYRSKMLSDPYGNNFIKNPFECYEVKFCKKWIELVLWWDIYTSNIEYHDIQYAADRTINIIK